MFKHMAFLFFLLIVSSNSFASTVEELFVDSTYAEFIKTPQGKEVNVMVNILSDQMLYSTTEKPGYNIQRVQVSFNEDGSCFTKDEDKKIVCKGNNLIIVDSEGSTSLTFNGTHLIYKSATLKGHITRRAYYTERND